AHCFDNTRTLVAEYLRHVHGEAGVAVDNVQIAVAHAGCHRADQHLAPAWRVNVDGFYAEGGSDLPKDGCLDCHATLPPRPRHGSYSDEARCRRMMLPTLAVTVDISTSRLTFSTDRICRAIGCIEYSSFNYY